MPVSFTATITSEPAASTAAAALRDWALDPLTGDLQIDPDTGDAVELTGTPGVISDLKSRFLTFFGEWFLDTTIGFDWFGAVLGQKYDEGKIRQAAETEALGCPGIVSVDSVTITRDSTLRSVSIVFAATLDVGAVITATLLAQQGAS